MLRITVQETPQELILKLEGSLIGSWVTELEDSWRISQNATLCFVCDLTGLQNNPGVHAGLSYAAGRVEWRTCWVELCMPGRWDGFTPTSPNQKAAHVVKSSARILVYFSASTVLVVPFLTPCPTWRAPFLTPCPVFLTT